MFVYYKLVTLIIIILVMVSGCEEGALLETAVLPNQESGEALPDATAVPSWNPPTIDGVLSPGEWDNASVETFADGDKLLLMPADDYLYLGIQASLPEMIGANIFIEENGQVRILHTSAALGTAVYQQTENSYQQIQDFAWRCRDTGNSESAQAERAAYLNENHWLAANSRMGSPNELEYQIELTGDSPRIAVSLFRSSAPNERAVWPPTLDDDTTRPNPGGLPAEMHFSTEEWATVALGQ